MAPTPATASSDNVWITTRSVSYDGLGNVTQESGSNNRCHRLGYDDVNGGQPMGYGQLVTSDTIYIAGCNTAGSLISAAAYDRGLGNRD